jgi:hypothetical protein
MRSKPSTLQCQENIGRFGQKEGRIESIGSLHSTVHYIKGTVSRDFLLLVFFMNQFPPSPRILHLDRFEFFRKIAEIFESQGAPPVSTTPVANLPPVSATPVANFSSIFASVVDTGGNLPPVSTIPAANLPPVSTTLVANCHRYQRHRWQICHRCQRQRWQIMATISGCRHLKVNLKPKIYTYVNSTTQRCPNKIIKFSA